MARIAPFRGIRYDARRFPDGDLSSVIAPPYDVLGQSDRERLIAGSERNIVVIDLPHMPPGFAGPPESYAGAAKTLSTWIADGTLIRENRPALYVYHQRFNHGGRRVTRKMFFARLRLEPFGTGSVFPHEQTFSGPKEDRLMLPRATQCNLSPIFGLYSDAANEVSTILDMSRREPTCHGVLEGIESRMWVVDDAAVIARVTKAMADREVFIADGHHRYGTSLMYRDERVAKEGPFPEEHPVNHVLVVFCAMEDDGLIILPTHRLLVNLSADRVLTALQSAEGIRVEPTPTSQDALDPLPPGRFRLYDGKKGEVWTFQADVTSVMERLAPDRSEAWRRLDVAVLQRYLIDEVVRPLVPSGQELEIRYIKDTQDGRRQAREKGGVQLELPATSLADMRDVCRAGELMPQKSTYFYPKPATGIIINPLSE